MATPDKRRSFLKETQAKRFQPKSVASPVDGRPIAVRKVGNNLRQYKGKAETAEIRAEQNYAAAARRRVAKARQNAAQDKPSVLEPKRFLTRKPGTDEKLQLGKKKNSFSNFNKLKHEYRT